MSILPPHEASNAASVAAPADPGRQTVLRIQSLDVALPSDADRPYAIQGLDLDVAAGEIVCLVGESGSGKSLTAGAVMRLLPEPRVRVTAGSIHLLGDDVLAMSQGAVRQLRGTRMAMIFQEPMTALNPQKRIGWQIDEMQRMHVRRSRAERREHTLAILERVHIPDPLSTIHAYPHQLSGGQRQRVMIAMALIMEPRLLIADEPTTALDVTTQRQVLDLIRELQSSLEMAVLFITHDFGVVAEIADRVAVMRHGIRVEEGDADRVLNDPQHDYTRQLIAAVPALHPPSQTKRASTTSLLSVHSLSKTYRASGGLTGRRRPAVVALAETSFELNRGETLGIVGESGSGKTTLSRCVMRLLAADTGQVSLAGNDLLAADASTLRHMRQDIQMIFQDPMASLNPRRRVIDLVAQGPRLHGASIEQAEERALELLERVGLSVNAAQRYPHEFSGGQRQRIGIARALALKPKVIVADEPVSALDVSVQAQVLDLLVDLKTQLGLSLLFVTHDLRVAARLCDRVAVMQNGHIVECGPVAEVFQQPAHEYTRALMASVPGRHWTPPHTAR